MTAAILNIDDYRRPTGGLPFGWHSLLLDNDGRNFVRMYARLGLHPLAIHGVAGERCTCGKSECPAAGKHPVERGWQTAELDVERLDAMLLERPSLNIGLRMGAQPGGVTLVCIDVDGDRSLLAPLEAKWGALPPTLTATSGKGLHLIYRMPEGKAAPKNRVRLAEGVDVRSEGGQIVCAPSLHRSGRRYRWTDARAPEVLP